MLRSNVEPRVVEMGLQGVLRERLDARDWGGAIRVLSQAVSERPHDAASWHNLGLCHLATAAPLMADTALKRASVIAPGSARFALSHARARLAAGRAAESVRLVARAGVMGAGDAKYHEVAALASAAVGDDGGAREHALAGFRRSPLRPSRYAADPRRLSVLVVVAYRDVARLRPTADGSYWLALHGTEFEHFLDENDRSVARHTAYIATDTDVEALARAVPRIDVVVNTVSEADEYPEELGVAGRLCGLIGAPVVNPPAATAALSRDEVYRRIRAAPGLVTPRCALVKVGSADRCIRTALAGFAWPVIVRPAGSHTGRGMVIAQDIAEVQAACAGESDQYVTEFVDFRSPDGWYRKYRVRVIDGQIIADHLFFGDTWKVHGEVRDRLMLNHAFMRDEERWFIEGFPGNLTDGQREALQAVGNATGLDYLGIDFAILGDGRLAVFEANASMRSSYPEWEQSFPMTREVTQALVAAFRQMLRRKAA